MSDELFETIGSRWFWVAAAFFLLIQFGDWIEVHWTVAILVAGAIALVNVGIFFGLSMWLFSKTDLEPNLFISAVLLLVANMATLLLMTPFLPNDFDGAGDYFLGALTMMILVGTAQSIPGIFKIGQ